jgi:hypothetical protein
MTTHKDLTPKFRHVRLLLAREKGHPEGERDAGYDLLIPLDDSGKLDPADWKTHQNVCRVRRFDGNEEERIGRLRRKPGGQWFIEYRDGEDDVGFRFGDERFVLGEYISIESDGVMHTYKVARVAMP